MASVSRWAIARWSWIGCGDGIPGLCVHAAKARPRIRAGARPAAFAMGSDAPAMPWDVDGREQPASLIRAVGIPWEEGPACSMSEPGFEVESYLQVQVAAVTGVLKKCLGLWPW
jgi:hypothetical protein